MPPTATAYAILTMIQLPKNLPALLAGSLQDAVKAETLSGLLAAVGELLLKMFSASEVIAILEVERHKESSAGRPLSFAMSAGGTSEDFSGKLIFNWLQRGIHKRVAKDLSDRMSPLSYSSMSWPYPRFDGTAVAGQPAQYSIPRQYTMFVPFGNSYIASLSREKDFFGYYALMFEDFPAYQDDVVALVVTLPQLLSEVVSVVIRRQALSEEYLSSYLADAKNNLLMCRELISRLKGVSDKNAIALSHSKIDSALTRMLLSCSSVLLAAEEAGTGLVANTRPTLLNDVAAEVVSELRPLFELSKVGLKVDLDNAISRSNIDSSILAVAIRNLLHNALIYSVAGRDVWLVTSAGEGSEVYLEVADVGIGVPPGEEQAIFSRFIRGSNVGSIPGAGIGLYLARRIAEAHGGALVLNRAEPGNSSFILSLPSL